MALMVVDGGIFGYYAGRNALASPFESHRAFWRYLVAIGGTAMVFGSAELVGLVVQSVFVTATSHFALFLFIAAISFAMREMYYNSALAPPPDERRVSLSTVRRVEFALFGVVALEWMAVVFIQRSLVTTAVRVGASVVLTAYGIVFNERLESLTAGTRFDTLRLHLLPILVIAGLLGGIDAARLLGGPETIVRGVESTLVVLVAGLLLPATIRLQQNVTRR
ncbi:MAG: hypothetical protein ABEI80_03530 [Haloplanus sp.]